MVLVITSCPGVEAGFASSYAGRFRVISLAAKYAAATAPGRFFRLSLALLLLGPANPGATVLVMPIDVPKAMRLLNGIVPGPGTKCP